MEKSVSIVEIWKKIIAFNDKHFPDWRTRDVIYVSNAIAGEAGEICNAIKRMAGGGTNKKKKILSTTELVMEVFDVFVYSVLMCEMFGVDCELFCDIADAKLAILEKRMDEAED